MQGCPGWVWRRLRARLRVANHGVGTDPQAFLGKLPPLPADGESFARHLAGLGFRDAPLLWADAAAANALPPHHRDPDGSDVDRRGAAPGSDDRYQRYGFSRRIGCERSGDGWVAL